MSYDGYVAGIPTVGCFQMYISARIKKDIYQLKIGEIIQKEELGSAIFYLKVELKRILTILLREYLKYK